MHLSMPLTPFYLSPFLSFFFSFLSKHVHRLKDLLRSSLNFLIGRLAFSAIHSLYTTLAGLAFFFMT